MSSWKSFSGGHFGGTFKNSLSAEHRITIFTSWDRNHFNQTFRHSSTILVLHPQTPFPIVVLARSFD